MNIMINSGRTSPFLGTRQKLVLKILEKGHNVILTGNNDNYEAKLNNMGAKYENIPVDRASLNPYKELKLIYKYYKLFKKNNIDVIHSYTIKPNIYGSIAAKLAGIKNIYPTINGLGYAYTGDDLKNKIIRLITSILYFFAFKCSKKVLFQNSDDADEMVKRKLINKRKCVIIDGSGIDLNEFTKRNLPEKISFIMITRLLKSKGVYQYLEAAKIVKGKYKNIEFKLVGPTDPNPNGVSKAELQNFIDKGIIKYLGYREDVHSLLSNSSVFVLPSYYREGVPHSILEAMATGRAILTTDAPGCRETVKEGVNGFLVPIKNEEALANKMIWMIEHPEEIHRMGEESYKYAKSRFNVEKVNNKIIKTMGII